MNVNEVDEFSKNKRTVVYKRHSYLIAGINSMKETVVLIPISKVGLADPNLERKKKYDSPFSELEV